MTNVVTNEPPQAPTIAAVVRRLQQRIDELPVTLAHRRSFAAAYRRTMIAVEEALDRARFEDPAWVERWDVTFADLFLEAHDSDRQGRTDDVPRPWRLAFAAPATLPAQRHVLLAMNAHVNYDLPQALLAVITDDDFGDPAIIGRRMRDHERFDAVLASRLSASDNHDKTRGTIDRLRAPLDRRRAQRMLTEAREPVWHNTTSLQRARAASATRYRALLAELELLTAAKATELLAPWTVMRRHAGSNTSNGFGVRLPPPE